MVKTIALCLALSACDVTAGSKFDKFFFGIPTHDEMQQEIDASRSLVPVPVASGSTLPGQLDPCARCPPFSFDAGSSHRFAYGGPPECSLSDDAGHLLVLCDRSGHANHLTSTVTLRDGGTRHLDGRDDHYPWHDYQSP